MKRLVVSSVVLHMTCYQVFFCIVLCVCWTETETEYPFRQHVVLDLVSYIPLTSLSLSFFLPATDSDDGEADRINRSQSAPDEDEHGPFLPFLTVYFKVKSGNPSYLISLLILSLLLSPSYTFTSFNAPVSFFFFFVLLQNGESVSLLYMKCCEIMCFIF